MGKANINTLQVVHPTVLGTPIQIPKNCEHDISVIFRVILAMDEEYDKEVLLRSQSSDVLIQRLKGYHQNIRDIAVRIREVVGHE